MAVKIKTPYERKNQDKGQNTYKTNMNRHFQKLGHPKRAN